VKEAIEQALDDTPDSMSAEKTMNVLKNILGLE